ncbi:BNR repeat-containing protein [Chitinophagaceae bacterium LB-8]|uniref:BNR repeat-containing protein n=1 Tax=Paraflavisolibacter caeni TaxID=2982496 RepID=A0A9X2XP14_9BACT|nr:BNR repeat-containing protein [Paraflavisolibacter caeni]MCU7550183.1 BNR repeat-containing protein [Paraflavisolibacter caeni]
MNKGTLLTVLMFCVITVNAQKLKKAKVSFVPVDTGWAANSVNTVIFRKNSLVTFGDTQFISFYDKDRYVVLGKRKLGTQKWELKKTPYQGNTADAHNTISMMVDGEGYLHLSWDHHNNPLRYARGLYPGSLQLTEKLPMTGKVEGKVSYPEFYKLQNGNLLFFYRDGGSGQGNLVINHYNTATKTWTQLHSNLIDGEGQRNAYWQACTDTKGTIHISWVWRESPDVASNHDLCYARSKDGGKTWEKSTGEKYILPITAATAEITCAIPQKSELINQTSMFADAAGNPYIATYWREQNTSFPQYHLVYNAGANWHTQNLLFRSTPFSLSGAGSKSIPIARPQIIAKERGSKLAAAIIFRDEERGNKASIAINKNLQKQKWIIKDLSEHTLGSWEPSYDTELWKNKGRLHLFIQNVVQVDAEGISNTAPQMVEVLEWQPDF